PIKICASPLLPKGEDGKRRPSVLQNEVAEPASQRGLYHFARSDVRQNIDAKTLPLERESVDVREDLAFWEVEGRDPDDILRNTLTTRSDARGRASNQQKGARHQARARAAEDPALHDAAAVTPTISAGGGFRHLFARCQMM